MHIAHSYGIINLNNHKRHKINMLLCLNALKKNDTMSKWVCFYLMKIEKKLFFEHRTLLWNFTAKTLQFTSGMKWIVLWIWKRFLTRCSNRNKSTTFRRIMQHFQFRNKLKIISQHQRNQSRLNSQFSI